MRQLDRKLNWKYSCSKCGGITYTSDVETIMNGGWIEINCLYCGKVEYATDTKWGMMVIIPDNTYERTHGNVTKRVEDYGNRYKTSNRRDRYTN